MSNEIKPIVLKARFADRCVGVIRLTPEAEKVVRRLHSRSNIPIRQIVSEIIIQSESLAECVATKDKIIHILSTSSDRYGNLLIVLMDRWGARSLQEITDEQMQKFWDETKRPKEDTNQ